MKKVFVKPILCASICMAVMAGMTLTGCAATVNAAESPVVTASAEAVHEMGERQRPDRKQDGQMAKVVAVEDDEITVMMAVQPERGERPEKKADGTAPSEKPADGTEPPEKPADGAEPPEKPADGAEPPEKPADGAEPPEKSADGTMTSEKPEGGSGMHKSVLKNMEMTFSEETTVLTLTDDTVITRGMGQETVSLSDLTEDSVIRVVLDGTTAVSIELMESRQEQEVISGRFTGKL